MSYFSDASLVFIPSAQKSGKAYSVKPTDGTGDLTFTRTGDTATRVGPDGLIEKVRTNLALQSEAFNTTWAVNGIVVTANTAANPLTGATNADTIAADAANNFHLINQSITYAAGEATVSVYVKANGYTWFVIDPSITNAFGYYNITTGVVGTKGSACTTSITNVGGGWYRCSVTFTATAGAAVLNFSIRNANNGGSFLGDGVSGFFIYGAQAETGVATDYIATTSAAVSVGPVANVPRLDYLNSSCPRLLLEPQRTNSLTFSEQLNNAAWTNVENVSVSANVSATLDPSGYYGADKLVENTANDQHRIYRSADGTNKTFSFFAKAAGRSWVSVLSNNGTFTYFNIGNGTLGTVAATSTATITPYANGWYRCTVYNTHGSFGSLIQLTTGNNVTSYLGDGTSGAYIWGAQLEAGAYATSYIPTLGAAVTRGADSASKTGISSLIGQTEGTLYCDVEWTLKPESGSPIVSLVALNNTTNLQNCIVLGIERQSGGTNRFYSFVQVSNSTTAALIGSNITNGRYKAAFAYKENDFVLYVNGVQIATDTSGAVPTNSQVIVGGRFVNDSFQVSDPISQALVFPTRLSNSDLAALTA